MFIEINIFNFSIIKYYTKQKNIMSGFMLIQICEHQPDPKYQKDKSRGKIYKTAISNLNEKKGFFDVIVFTSNLNVN